MVYCYIPVVEEMLNKMSPRFTVQIVNYAKKILYKFQQLSIFFTNQSQYNALFPGCRVSFRQDSTLTTYPKVNTQTTQDKQ